jgi:hypothetical protein
MIWVRLSNTVLVVTPGASTLPMRRISWTAASRTFFLARFQGRTTLHKRLVGYADADGDADALVRPPCFFWGRWQLDDVLLVDKTTCGAAVAVGGK